MEKSNSYESVCDFAISKFRESLNEAENEYNYMEDFDFPHWKELTQKVVSVWQKSFSDKFKIYYDENRVDILFSNFRSSISKIMAKRTDYQMLKKYIDFVIDYRMDQIKNEMIDTQMEQKENMSDQQQQPHANKLSLKPVVKLDPLSVQQVATNNAMAKKREVMRKIHEFEMQHLIRGHSKDSNINDNSTIVADVAFELNPNTEFGVLDSLPTYTNLYATCGHNIINIIDSETGKITKRFNDDLLMNKNKESYNCLAWTIMNNNLSFLFAAGAHGQVKVIVPKYSCCFARIDAHTAPITCLLVHYKYPNILLTASEDNTVKIWKIALKEGQNDLESECSNELLNTIQLGDTQPQKSKETIFSMCFVSNGILLISTANNIYSVTLTDDFMYGRNQAQPMDVSNQNGSNDDAISFMTSKPKTKDNLMAKPVKMIGISAQNVVYEEKIITNKLIFYKNVLIANLLKSNLVYFIEVSNELDDENLILKVVSNIKVGDEKTTELNKLSIYKDESFVHLIKSQSDGNFAHVTLGESLKEYITLLRYKIPTDYTIKPYSDPGKKTNVKNYGLMEYASVVDAVCNGSTIVSITNQNMIVTWKKGRVLPDQCN